MFKVLDEYRRIMVHLAEKPDTIERIFEIRDWMETIPMTVRTQDELTRRYCLVSNPSHIKLKS